MIAQSKPSSMSVESKANPAASHPLPSHNGSSPTNDWSTQGKRIQELVEQAGTLLDPAARALLNECLETLLALHGQGLARMLELIKNAEPDGQGTLDSVAQDPLLRGLLLI